MENDKELIIFCDESDKSGKYYSNFYGGILVGSSNYQRVTNYLNQCKNELNLFGEVKWEKVTERYLEKYKILIRKFFHEVKIGTVKIRIMFTQNARIPKGLNKIQFEDEYFILYYQFIKNAFGLGDLPEVKNPRNLRIYFDIFPQRKLEKIEKFKGYLMGLQEYRFFKKANLIIKKENITEVRSHEHVLMQCLDIVLGSMSSRLNDKHKVIPKGKKRRAKRTIAKEELYKTILNEIRQIRKNFNIGVTSKTKNYMEMFSEPYLHWCFVPRNHIYNEKLTKKGGKK